MEVTGKRAYELFKHEAGGHRWQTVSPTDKKGRVHTSTVTVAVMPAPINAAVGIRESDIEWQATKGSGKGGQARNKTSNAVQMTHKPSGMTVRVESERSQSMNRATALRLLAARLAARVTEAAAQAEASWRRDQVGSGQRGDKRRTYRSQDDSVADHVTGKVARLKRIEKGFLEDLHPGS